MLRPEGSLSPAYTWNWRVHDVDARRLGNSCNIEANDHRLIAVVQYENGVMLIRFFGSHEEYDKVDAETV